MDGTKLNLSGKTGGNEELPPPATYKAIPETDMEEEAVTRPKSLVKMNANSPEIDGADEKMLPKEKDAVNSNIDISDVKIATNEKQNGDAKLDIGDVKSAFVGLTKEELMKYANDPFWVRLRWFLFVTFWLLWAAMLVGAIMIICAAPRCDPPPPRTWYEEGPLTEAQHSIQNEELNSLKEKGVKGLIVNWPEADSYSKIDETHDFLRFVKQAKENNLNVIVDLEPGVSKLWFERSVNKDEGFADYYIWRAAKGVSSNGVPEPPNNWLSIKNISSWIYSEERKEYYYAPKGTPHLNFRNPNVTEEFSNVIRYVIKSGAQGIRIKDAAHLLVDPKFEDEGIKKNAYGFVHTDYGFYTHSKTENLLDLAPLLLQWKKIVKNDTDNGPFMIADDLTSIEAYKINSSLIIDLPLESRLLTKSNLIASDIVKGLDSIFNNTKISWPLWKYNNADSINILAFLLPGAPLIDKDAPVNTELLKLRDSPSIMRGTFNYSAVANRTTFAFIRVTSGNPGVLVAYNPTSERVVVDFPSEIPAVSEEVTVQLFSSNYNETDVALNTKQDAHKIPISPKATIVLSYVPKGPQ